MVFITVVTNKRREIFIENIELLKHSIFSCIDKNKEYKRLFQNNSINKTDIFSKYRYKYYELSKSNIQRKERDIW